MHRDPARLWLGARVKGRNPYPPVIASKTAADVVPLIDAILPPARPSWWRRLWSAIRAWFVR